MKPPTLRPDIRSQTRDELSALLAAWGEPPFRAPQVLSWLYAWRVASWDAMTNLPRPLRHRLASHFQLHPLTLERCQGAPGQTRKFLWRLADGAHIESVLIPANPALYAEPSDRLTLCVSTQVGCAFGCKFCASGLHGWKRNLGPDEIVEQVLAAERWLAANASSQTPSLRPSPPRRRIDNLVVMGMGEPLANYDALSKALAILNAPWGGAIGARHITVSTCGLAPQIRRFADESPQFRLAISLHGATDAIRNRLMPVNRKYPLSELISACEHYLARKGRMISLEYILIDGVNDGLDQAHPLAALARRLRAKINLIPCNPVHGLPWRRPAPPAQAAFLHGLKKAGVTATLRIEKGDNIDAACGQLRLQAEAAHPAD
ncbi:MAG: 23S rRNA (adenine(2503)-C(2))-methyltransferase RlmN [Verrucomicrobia bacterium]|nr:23S rRNA (adenine(2503)-C(2))-methyltransferase RlmN [Verrucomicrobiota bacterium]